MRASTDNETSGDETTDSGGSASILHQPRAVWAVAFAAVIAFMGIGLVDPILPAISAELDATPAQSMLLFTSYLFITGGMMFFTSYLSSRIGAKTTLLVGLILIVAFSALAGFSGSVDQIIGFRAGWGLGNALFISTALSTIVGAASGGAEKAIILYEAALGVGIATGPLLGGTARRHLVARTVLRHRCAHGHRLHRHRRAAAGRHELERGLRRADQAQRDLPRTGAPRCGRARHLRADVQLRLLHPARLQSVPCRGGGREDGHRELRRHGTRLRVLRLGHLRGDHLGVRGSAADQADGTSSQPHRHSHRAGGSARCDVVPRRILTGLIICIVIAGMLLGVLNTVFTESAMEVSDLPRPVASGTYSGVRFVGGAVAPIVAGSVSESISAGAPYLFGAGVVLLSVVVISIGWKTLRRVDGHIDEAPVDEAYALTGGDA
jgi:ACDE family multidrug resistance protein